MIALSRPLILYAEDFDAPPDPPPPIALPAPLFTAAELAAERAAGRAEGVAAASADARAVQAALQTAALQQLADALHAARAAAAEAATASAEATARIMLAILHAALPATMAAHGTLEVAALAEMLLPRLRREPALTITAHPDRKALLQTVAAETRVTARIVADPAVEAGDLRVTWQDGEASRDGAAIRAALAAALPPLVHPAPPEAVYSV